MKKLFYFTLLLSVALVFAQDEENGEEEVLSRCFNGTSGDDGGAITEVPCDFSTVSYNHRIKKSLYYVKACGE